MVDDLGVEGGLGLVDAEDGVEADRWPEALAREVERPRRVRVVPEARARLG